MAIYRPDLVLSETDREVLLLLGRLVIASESKSNSNFGPDDVPLSPREAQTLLELLEQFASSKLFIEGAYFCEAITNENSWCNEHVKEIYFSWRSKRGKTNVSTQEHWKEFTVRAGFSTSENAWIWPARITRSPVRPMTLQHFVAMERKLAEEAGLHPRVRELIMNFINDSLPKLRDIRQHRAKIREGSIQSTVTTITKELSNHVNGFESSPMPRRKLIALSTIIMDTGAFFATRDWTATGVLSTLAGVASDALEYRPE